MLNKEREREILNILRLQNGFVSTKMLCSKLYASESSIRRDLKSLEKNNLIRRAYGGAELITSPQNIMNFNHRVTSNEQAKYDIAKKAVNLINEGDIVFLDQSSTAFYLAKELLRKKITVVTNNIEILMLLSDSSAHAISSGGYLSGSNKTCLIGNDAITTFNNIYADIVFFSAKNISDDGIITDCDREEIAVRNAMFANSKKRVFLCDSSKFGKTAQYKQCNLNELDAIISEGETAKLFKEKFEQIQII